MTAKEAIEANVRRTIRGLKKDGVTAMSVDNLRQITPTVGVTCSVPMYFQLFSEVAADAGRQLKFTVQPKATT